MKLKDVVKPVNEMAKVAQICAHCGKSKAEGHYYYKGSFRCKGKGDTFVAAGGSTSPESEVPTKVTPSPSPAPNFGAGTNSVTAVSTSVSSDSSLKAALDKWLKSHNVENFTIQPDGTIDVDGDVRFDNMRMPKFPGPVKFGTVSGCFIASSSGLTTLRGCPQHVGTSGEYQDYMIDYNDITTLEGGPSSVGGSFSCTGCENLDSLQHLPEKIGGSVFAQNLPKITSLQGIHKMVRQINGIFDLTGTPIHSHLLGLLMIKGLNSVKLDNSQVAEIINKHLKLPERNAHEAQEELIEAGFSAFAKL